MRGKPSAGINVGGSSILVVFVLLCLTTFATLAMVSASANYRLAQRVVASIDAFYEADGRAEEILAEISAVLAGVGGENPADALEAVGLDVYVQHSALQDDLLRYSVPIDEGRSLQVALRHYSQEGRLDIIEWRVVAEELPADFGANAPAIWVGG